MAVSEGGVLAAQLREAVDNDEVPDYIVSRMRSLFSSYQAPAAAARAPTDSSDGGAVGPDASSSSHEGAAAHGSSGWFHCAAADALRSQCADVEGQQSDLQLSDTWRLLQKAATSAAAAAEAGLGCSPTRLGSTSTRQAQLLASRTSPRSIRFASTASPSASISNTTWLNAASHQLPPQQYSIVPGAKGNGKAGSGSSRPATAAPLTTGTNLWQRPSTAPGTLLASRPGTAASLTAGTRPATAKSGTWGTTGRTSTSSSTAAAAGVPKEAVRLMRQYHEHSLILRGGRCKAAVDSGVQQQEWEQLEGLLVQLDQVYRLHEQTRLQQQAAGYHKQLASTRRQATSVQCIPQVMSATKMAHLQAQLAAARKALAKKDKEQNSAVLKMAEHGYHMVSMLEGAAAEREQLETQLMHLSEREGRLKPQLQASFLQGVAWQAADTAPQLAALTNELSAASGAFQQQLHDVLYSTSWRDVGELEEMLQAAAADMVTTVQEAAAHCTAHVDEARLVGTLLQQQQQQ